MKKAKKTQFEPFETLPDILSVAQVRQALSIGRVGVYKLLTSGKIHSFKVGNVYKIPKSSLIEFVDRSSGNREGDD